MLRPLRAGTATLLAQELGMGPGCDILYGLGGQSCRQGAAAASSPSGALRFAILSCHRKHHPECLLFGI